MALVASSLMVLTSGRLPASRAAIAGLVLMPSLFVTLTGASRRFLLIALAAAVLGAIFRRRLDLRGGRAIPIVVLTAATVAVALAIQLPSRVLGDDHVITDSIDAFTTRVTQKLEANEVAGDNWRVEENGYATAYISEQWLIGGGMGATYRPALADSPFDDEQAARRYVHNFYYWVMVKAGIVGLAALAWLVWVATAPHPLEPTRSDRARQRRRRCPA